MLGAVSVYERDGKYQLYAREIILDGAGLLYERFEALKKELEEMGMFAAGVQTADSTLCTYDRGCDRTDRSSDQRYHQCGKEKESICPDPALSCTGTG